MREPGFDPWVGELPWRRAWHPLQYSRLEDPMDRAAWRTTVHGVASQTRFSAIFLSFFAFHSELTFPSLCYLVHSLVGVFSLLYIWSCFLKTFMESQLWACRSARDLLRGRAEEALRAATGERRRRSARRPVGAASLPGRCSQRSSPRAQCLPTRTGPETQILC